MADRGWDGLSGSELKVLAAIVERFEDAWSTGTPPDLPTFLAEAGDDPATRPVVLEELVRIDLEYRWRTPRGDGHGAPRMPASADPHLRPGPLSLEEYVDWLPELGPLEKLPVDLIVEEYRARTRWGDRPDHGIYAARFPEQATAILAAFARAAQLDSTVDHGSAARSADSDRTSPGEKAPAWAERYELIDLHGSGGLGRVWRAYDHDLERDVALKEIRPALARDPRVRARFLREARLTGRLEHPSIVPVHELRGRSESEPLYYIMRLVKGRTLAEAAISYHKERGAGRAGSIEFRALLGALVSISNAIAFAHARGVIHRDLKGPNVVLGEFGEVLVLDWGLARATRRPDDAGSESSPSGAVSPDSPGDTAPGELLGTPSYMAPEQAGGQTDKIDQRTDVYGLGAILYEILTGRPPYVGPGAEDVLAQVRKGAPVRPRAIAPNTPRALEAVCLKAIARQPSERYPSAATFAADLERWLADEPVSAWREPALVRLGRWGRRHKPLAAAVLALLVTATIALATGYVLVSREKDRADLRSRQARRAVDEMYTQVAERWLADQPRMQAIQREFLEKALRFYEEFARERSSDPAVRRGVGLAQRHVGDIQSRLGDHGQAEQAYRRAIAMQQALADNTPGNLDHRADLAVSHNNLGFELVALSRPDEAEAAYRHAIEIQEKLVATRESPEFRSALAQSWGNLGDLYRSIGKMRDAEQAFEQSLNLNRALAAGKPADLERQRDLASSLVSIGLVQENSRRPDEAVARLREALDLQNRIVASPAARPDYRMELANSETHIGRVLKSVGRLNEAEQALTSARNILERLVADYPDVPRYRMELVANLNSLALLLRDNGKPTDAELVYRRAIERQQELVERYPELPEHAKTLGGITTNLAVLLASTGRADEAEQIIQKSLDKMEKLAARFPTVPDYAYALAITYHTLGNLRNITGRAAPAEQAFRRAVELYEALTALSPDVSLYQQHLAGSLSGLGTLLADHGKPDEGVRAVQRALGIQDRLMTDNPKNLNYRLELATTLNNLGIRLMNLGASADAERAYRRSLDLRQKLSQEVPGQPVFVSDWSASLNNLGQLLSSLDRPDEAGPALRRALELRERLVREHPKVIQYAIDLAGGYGNFGRFQRMTGHPEESLDWFGRAIQTGEDVLRREPRLVEPRSVVRNAHASRSLALAALGKYKDALADVERAMEVEGNGSRRDALLVDRALVVARLGDYRRAAADAEALTRAKRRTGPDYYKIACVLSVASATARADARLAPEEAAQHADSYAARAVKLLSAAYAEGYFTQAGAVRDLLGNRDLDPIRTRADFQAALPDWAFPVNPFAR